MHKTLLGTTAKYAEFLDIFINKNRTGVPTFPMALLVAGFISMAIFFVVFFVLAYCLQRSFIYIPKLPKIYHPFPCTPDKAGFAYDENTILSYHVGDSIDALSFSKSVKISIQTKDLVNIKVYWLPFNSLDGNACECPESLPILIFFHANAGDYVSFVF